MRIFKWILFAGAIIGALYSVILAQEPPPTEGNWTGDISKMSTKQYGKERCVFIKFGSNYLYYLINGTPEENVWASMLTTNLYNNSKCNLLIAWEENLNKLITFSEQTGVNYWPIKSIEIRKEE